MSDQAMAEIEAAMKSMEALANPSGGSKPAPAKVKDAPRRTRQRPSGKPERQVVSPKPAHRSKPKGPIHQRLITFLVGTAVAVFLPFYLLLRLSVYLNQTYQIWPWLAIAGGVAATVILLMLYAAWARWRLGAGFKFSKGVTRGLAILVAIYVGYTAMYISAANVKTDDVRATYTSLHPLLRLGVSTFMLADQEVVMTDAQRQPEDYARMGLPVNEGSLHFRQDGSGYVHAVDLRTNGRGEWKNFLMTLYFKIAGFRTLRHTGTADHLHVSLPVDSD